MDVVVTTTVSLLIVAIVVALIARRLAFPYTIGLVITGIGLALTRHDMDVVLTHEFIFDVILPPLLFEAAINIHWKELRRDALPILTLALIGTIISAGVVATGMVFGLSWPVAPALLFGVLIAATDPVAVIAMFKDNGIEGRLRLLVESESLFNDGVAAVLFSLVLAGILTTQRAGYHRNRSGACAAVHCRRRHIHRDRHCGGSHCHRGAHFGSPYRKHVDDYCCIRLVPARGAFPLFRRSGDRRSGASDRESRDFAGWEDTRVSAKGARVCAGVMGIYRIHRQLTRLPPYRLDGCWHSL